MKKKDLFLRLPTSLSPFLFLYIYTTKTAVYPLSSILFAFPTRESEMDDTSQGSKRL